MITREVRLHTGIKVDETGMSKIVTIREEVLDDELTLLETGLDGLRAHRLIMMRRVVQIGSLASPDASIVRKMTRTDWELVERGLQKLDLELSIESGLTKPAGDSNAGRDEPGGATPGDA